MKRFLAIAVLIFGSVALGQHEAMKMPPQTRLEKGLGAVHHKVTTRNAEAQAFFDQGLAQIYGFNHDEAVRSFQRAADLDPGMAMAYWGIALARGSNYNWNATSERSEEHTSELQSH